MKIGFIYSIFLFNLLFFLQNNFNENSNNKENKLSLKSRFLKFYNQKKKELSNYLNRLKRDLKFFQGIESIIGPFLLFSGANSYFKNKYYKNLDMQPNEKIKIITDSGNFLFPKQIKIGFNLTKAFGLKNKKEITYDHCKNIFLELKDYIVDDKNTQIEIQNQIIDPNLINIKIKNSNNLLILIINFKPINNLNTNISKNEIIHINRNNVMINNQIIFKEYILLKEYFSKTYIPSYYDTFFDILYYGNNGYAYEHYSDFSWKIIHPWLS